MYDTVGPYVFWGRNIVERGSSGVECRIHNREILGSNPLCCCFHAWAFSFSPRRPSSISSINEYLAMDGGGHVSEKCSLGVAACLECFPEK